MLRFTQLDIFHMPRLHLYRCGTEDTGYTVFVIFVSHMNQSDMRIIHIR